MTLVLEQRCLPKYRVISRHSRPLQTQEFLTKSFKILGWKFILLMFSAKTCTPCTFQKKRLEYFNGLMHSHGFVCLGWVPRVIGRSICMEFPLPHVDHPLSSSANFFCLIFLFCSIKNLSTKFLIKNCSIAESDPKQSAYNIKSLLVAAPIQFGGPGGERILKRRLGS